MIIIANRKISILTLNRSGDGPAANPYPAPSIEGALPLPKILAGAWSPNIVFNPHPQKPCGIKRFHGVLFVFLFVFVSNRYSYSF